MNKTFISEFSKLLAGVFPFAGKAEFTIKLADMFKQLVSTDNVMVIVFPSKKLPIIEYNDLPSDERSSMVNKYIKGAFLLDPFYLAARNKYKSGFFRLTDVAPDAFEESEYYNSYYKYAALTDECNYLIQYGEGGEKFILVSLGLVDVAETFTDEQFEFLSAITPLIEALIKYHWKTIEHEQEIEHHLDMREQLETALECFGTSILTERENQTVKMILQGYSSKAIAERFKISVETVKLHRKNAYAKLDLGTQGELFNLFINSLMSIENYSGGDPLISYHSVSVG